jgi:hypothetical protein
MWCLVPFDTSVFGSNIPPNPVPTAFTLAQALAQGATSFTFNLSTFGFTSPPVNIIATLLLSGGAASNISCYPQQWTATSFTADLSSPTDSANYVASILVIPAIP